VGTTEGSREGGREGGKEVERQIASSPERLAVPEVDDGNRDAGYDAEAGQLEREFCRNTVNQS